MRGGASGAVGLRSPFQPVRLTAPLLWGWPWRLLSTILFTVSREVAIEDEFKYVFSSWICDDFFLFDAHPIQKMSRKWLRKGAIIEVFTDNDWWDAEVVVFNKNFVRIHYVGGSSPRPSRSALRIHALSSRSIGHLDCCSQMQSCSSKPLLCGQYYLKKSVLATEDYRDMHTGDESEDEWLAQDSDRMREHSGALTLQYSSDLRICVSSVSPSRKNRRSAFTSPVLSICSHSLHNPPPRARALSLSLTPSFACFRRIV